MLGRIKNSLWKTFQCLKLLLRQIKPALVIIDPIVAYIGEKTSTDRDSAIRRVLKPVAKLAERWRVAIVGVICPPGRLSYQTRISRAAEPSLLQQRRPVQHDVDQRGRRFLSPEL